jgi:hypothetical protein
MSGHPALPELAEIVQENVIVPAAPVVSVAVTEVVTAWTVVGVPVMIPVAELMLIPAGRLEEVHVSVWPVAESVDTNERLLATPTVPTWGFCG